MKQILICFLLIFGFTGLAQDQGPMKSGQPLGKALKSKKPKEDSKVSAGEIRGRCMVEAGGSALVAGPCSETILVLNNAKGEEVLKTRTDRNGAFEFTALDEGMYKIVSGSRFFDVIKPTVAIHTGQTIDLELQQK